MTADDEIYSTETFGPIVGVAKFSTFDEAMELANGHGYGLSSAIYTRCGENAFRFRERITAGMVSVNNSTSGAEAHLPFGGNGKSGNGSRQSGIWVLDQFTRWQSMNWDYAGKLQKAQMDLVELPGGHGLPPLASPRRGSSTCAAGRGPYGSSMLLSEALLLLLLDDEKGSRARWLRHDEAGRRCAARPARDGRARGDGRQARRPGEQPSAPALAAAWSALASQCDAKKAIAAVVKRPSRSDRRSPRALVDARRARRDPPQALGLFETTRYPEPIRRRNERCAASCRPC